MTFLTSYMEAMLGLATDPEEIAARRNALEDHLAHQQETPSEFETLSITNPEGVRDMKEFCDLISQAIEVAPSPGTRQQLVDILVAAEGGAAGGTAPQTLDSGGGGHTDPDHPGGGG